MAGFIQRIHNLTPSTGVDYKACCLPDKKRTIIVPYPFTSNLEYEIVDGNWHLANAALPGVSAGTVSRNGTIGFGVCCGAENVKVIFTVNYNKVSDSNGFLEMFMSVNPHYSNLIVIETSGVTTYEVDLTDLYYTGVINPCGTALFVSASFNLVGSGEGYSAVSVSTEVIIT
jgi:hypothetical protein